MRAVEEIEAMVARGFNHGVRLAGARPRWVWPIPPLAVYYRDDGQRILAWPRVTTPGCHRGVRSSGQMLLAQLQGDGPGTLSITTTS